MSRRGRPSLGDLARHSRVHAQLTAEEARRVREAAQAAGLSVSDWLRALAVRALEADSTGTRPTAARGIP